jgi:hypothetical protein
MSDPFFVPVDFEVPDRLTAEEFRLEPLGPEHNAADYAAWTASIGHIQATPGFAGTGWPHEMSLAENLRDLERQARDFADRHRFTYTALSTRTGEVIGCVYIYPPRGESQGGASLGEQPAAISSWVRADQAALDPVLLPHGPRMAGTRLAVPLDRVRATGLTWCHRTGWLVTSRLRGIPDRYLVAVLTLADRGSLRHLVTVARLAVQLRSVTSVRAGSTNRSAKASARGLRGGIFAAWISGSVITGRAGSGSAGSTSPGPAQSSASPWKSTATGRRSRPRSGWPSSPNGRNPA